MTSFEERIRSKIKNSADIPDPETFLASLHQEIERRIKRKQSVIKSTSVLILMFALTFGLFKNLTINGDSDFWITNDFQLLSGVDEMILYNGTSDIDESFVFEALEYMIQESDFIGNGWDILENLDELGVIDFEETLVWEEQS